VEDWCMEEMVYTTSVELWGVELLKRYVFDFFAKLDLTLNSSGKVKSWDEERDECGVKEQQGYHF
jgi:hypothetical protein